MALTVVAGVAAFFWTVTIAGSYVLSWRDAGLVVFLGVLATLFEEGVARATRLQIRLAANLKRDMTSVWAVACAAALPGLPAVAVLVILFTYTWFRQHRPAGRPALRMTLNVATMVFSCLFAGWVARTVHPVLDQHSWFVAGATTVAVAMMALTLMNRAIVTLALIVLGARGRDLLGSKDDNLLEFATLCLGGLVALALHYEPVLAVLAIAPMVTLQRGSLVRELEAAAMTDSKTGLLNAVAWEQLATRELARAVRENSPLAVMIIDIDRFKTVNDRFGHLVGDKVLRGIGASLTNSLRGYDGIGRFGGEEFVAVLPDADEVSALVVAERVRARVNQVTVAEFVDGLDDGPENLLSVSVGVACLRADGHELADLLHAADQALYYAKNNGRNQVQLARRGGEIADRVAG